MTYMRNEAVELQREANEIKRKRAEALRRQVLIKEAALYRSSFAEFVKAAWPMVVPGTHMQWNWHHDVICTHLERVYRREIKRLIINIPPRHTKSIIVSVLFPIWVWINQPSHQFYCFSHTDDLALRDALHARRVMESKWFLDHFGNPNDQPEDPITGEKYKPMRLMADQNAKGRYENNSGGHRLSQGITGNITGDGGDTILIDDPHDAEKVLSDIDRKKVCRTFDDVITSRLNNHSTGAIIVIMQRLHELDLTGHLLLKKSGWVHICLPQEFELKHPHKFAGDPRTKEGQLLWPERVGPQEIDDQKKNSSAYAYAGQRQQRPAPEGGGILKSQWFRIWPADRSPGEASLIIDSWDTAFSEADHEKNSRSAMTRWAVIWHENQGRYILLLCKAWAGHVTYPNLRARAKKEVRDNKPDVVLVEKKASGQSLIQDLRMTNIPILGFQPDRDKVARAYAVQAMLQDGQIFIPEGRSWAEEFVMECSTFPTGAYDDYVDTATQAWLYVRNSMQVQHSENFRGRRDIDDDEDDAPSADRLKPLYG